MEEASGREGTTWERRNNMMKRRFLFSFYSKSISVIREERNVIIHEVKQSSPLQTWYNEHTHAPWLREWTPREDKVIEECLSSGQVQVCALFREFVFNRFLLFCWRTAVSPFLESSTLMRERARQAGYPASQRRVRGRAVFASRSCPFVMRDLQIDHFWFAWAEWVICV